jgi:hypothetical protein
MVTLVLLLCPARMMRVLHLDQQTQQLTMCTAMHGNRSSWMWMAGLQVDVPAAGAAVSQQPQILTWLFPPLFVVMGITP